MANQLGCNLRALLPYGTEKSCNSLELADEQRKALMVESCSDLARIPYRVPVPVGLPPAVLKHTPLASESRDPGSHGHITMESKKERWS